MLMDPMGGIVMTSDGNAILREIVVQHPAAKSMIEIARTQDEEVGDGTTSVIVLGRCSLPFVATYSYKLGNTQPISTCCPAALLPRTHSPAIHSALRALTRWLSACIRVAHTAGEMLSQAEQFISENMHPTVVIGAYLRALDDAVELLEKDISVRG